MPSNTLAGATPNKALASFQTALAALIAQHNLSDFAYIDEDGVEKPVFEMRLHQDETAMNFAPASHKDAPQYITGTLRIDGEKIPVTFDDDSYKGNRVQVAFNVFRIVPTSWQPSAPAASASESKETPKKQAMTLDAIRAARSKASHITSAPGK